MQFEIRCLPEDEEVMRTVACWIFDEWSEDINSSSPEDLMPGLRQRIHCASIPFTIVAFHGSRPVGTASLFFQDMDTHKHLSPWLAAVYVEPEFRHREIGRSLCADVVARARSLSVAALYLFTPDRIDFYRRMNWRPIERANYRNKTVTIMRLLLD